MPLVSRKSRNTTNLFCAGSLDGAPIITQSRRHKPCSKIEVSYSAHSQLAFDASLLSTDCQRDCDCHLRLARCCAAAVRSHNNTQPTHPRRAPVPGVAGYKRSAHTNTHTPQHPSQEWRGAAETRAQANTPTPHTAARSGGVQAERAHKHTHTPTPQQGVAGRSRSPSPSTHTHTTHPSQEWRGTSGAGTQTHTHPKTPARCGGVQAERAHEHTHTPTPQPGVAGRSRNASPSTRTHAAHPSQEWRGTSGARILTRTHPNTPARSGRAQPKPKPEHTHPRRTP